MKFIVKNESPKAFEEWKESTKPKTWNDLQSSLPRIKEEEIVYYSKQELRQSLLEEQGFICCYCTRRIKDSIKRNDKEATIIEHLLPREKHPKLTFEYDNLLASCIGGNEENPPEDKFCDAKKGNNEIEITPLIPDCERYFSFKQNGKIVANSEVGKNTIDTLNLNCTKLTNQRTEFLNGFQIETLTDKDIEILLQKIEHRNENNQFLEFGVVLKSRLQKFFNL